MYAEMYNGTWYVNKNGKRTLKTLLRILKYYACCCLVHPRKIQITLFFSFLFYSPNMTANNEYTGIFNPAKSSGLCRYEVAYTNTSLIGKNKVCLMVW